MKRMIQLIIALTIVTVSTVSVLAQSNNSKIIEQIMKLEAEHAEVSKKLDAEGFDRFYAADFMVTARIPPKLVTRAERLAQLKDPNFRRGTVESLTNDDLKVRVYGDDTAIVTSAWKRVSRDTDGKDTSASGRFTHVWVKQNGKWLLAAAHYSPNIDLEKLKAAAQSADKKK